MPNRMRPPPFCVACALAGACLALCLSALLLHAAPPKIDHIERVKSGALNGVLIHCTIEPDRIYALQYTTNLGVGGVLPGPWSTLQTTLPFQGNHTIFYDSITESPARFYRLKELP